MVTKEEQLKVKLVKKIFQEDMDFSDGDYTFDRDINDTKGELLETVRYRENIWDHFMDYLVMANSIIEENLKVSKDYMKKKIYYEIDTDDGDASGHHILIKSEDWLFPQPSFHYEVKRKPIAKTIFEITIENRTFHITFKDLIENIKNTIEISGKKFNKLVKKQWENMTIKDLVEDSQNFLDFMSGKTDKLSSKTNSSLLIGNDGFVAEEIDEEELQRQKEEAYEKLCDLKKFKKILKKSEELCKVKMPKFKSF